MFQNDYIMREIEGLTRFLAKIIFDKDLNSLDFLDEDGTFSGGDLLYSKLKQLLGDGNINAAENLLFEELEKNPTNENLQVAFRFYDDLQKLSDEQLEKSDFSREEILDGLRCIEKNYVLKI